MADLDDAELATLIASHVDKVLLRPTDTAKYNKTRLALRDQLDHRYEQVTQTGQQSLHEKRRRSSVEFLAAYR